VRLDEVKSVFRSPGQGGAYSSCDCCHAPSDYHLLSSLKSKLKSDMVESEVETSAANDSDDDFLDDDDYISPAQQALLEQVAANALRMRNLSAIGLGAHKSESPDHFLQLLKSTHITNMVLHIVNTNVAGSPLVDVIFEDLAQKYTGTYFRRIPRESILHHSANFFKDISSSGNIVSIKNGLVVDQSSDILARFYDHHRISSIDDITAETIATAKGVLETYMMNLHVLSDTTELVYRSDLSSGVNGVVAEEEEEVQEAYCGVKGCGRMFPHKHISSEQESTGDHQTSSLLVNESNQQGVEALSESYFTSL